jgi:hypothetical protein
MMLVPVETTVIVRGERQTRTVYMRKSLTWSGHKLQGRTTFQGLNISIENRAGTYRRGTDPDGHEWKTKLHNDYGYIRGSVGVDGDHVDCFIGPDRDSRKVYIIHQVKPGTQTYDEDKVMLGFSRSLQAKKAYLSNYDRSDMFGSMETVTIAQLKSLIERRKWRKLTKGNPVLVRRIIKSRPGLVPKRVTYNRNGRSVDGTVWVRRDDIQLISEARRFMQGDPVISISGNEFRKDGTPLVDRVAKFFESIGGVVTNPMLGKIVLNRRSVKDSLSHGYYYKRISYFAAIPDELKRGMVVDHQSNWKGRGYDTHVIVAPIAISGDRYHVAAVLISPPTGNRFYTHEVIVEKESRDAPFKTGTLENKGNPSGQHPDSLKMILRRISGVNEEKQ